ncbi:MAG: hypothetical protein FRX49_10720 [Trebouxia sp. A1-2]|nr:MAG: hypothetical protein FRX49_10720 [Trebouxia sp. A1-2]
MTRVPGQQSSLKQIATSSRSLQLKPVSDLDELAPHMCGRSDTGAAGRERRRRKRTAGSRVNSTRLTAHGMGTGS